MKLEEAKKVLEHHKKVIIVSDCDNGVNRVSEALETVLQALDNSISKDKVKEKIEELQEKLKHYDKSNILEQINADKIEAEIQVLEELLKEN